MFMAFANILNHKGAVLTEMAGSGKTPQAARAAALRAAHLCIASRRMHGMVARIEVEVV